MVLSAPPPPLVYLSHVRSCTLVHTHTHSLSLSTTPPGGSNSSGSSSSKEKGLARALLPSCAPRPAFINVPWFSSVARNSLGVCVPQSAACFFEYVAPFLFGLLPAAKQKRAAAAQHTTAQHNGAAAERRVSARESREERRVIRPKKRHTQKKRGSTETTRGE